MRLTIIIFLISFALCYSQDRTDTLLYKPINDTLTKQTDTTKRTGDVDAVIEYTAKDSAVFDLKGNKLYLYGDGELKFKEYDLKAARVIFHKETSVLEAYGIPDTGNTGKYIGLPIFYEGSKRYDAFKLKYNFNTKKGNIEMGSTELEGGYYLGENIKKVGSDIYFIKNGSYTTCDKQDPDFYFGSPKMKVIQGDKVIAEPVYLYVAGVPLFVIPFGIFPNHTGRSSGIIPPAYGEDATYGKYLSHLGYFWAINDFVDLMMQGNYFTNGRIDLSGRFRYVLRYKFTGELDVGGSRIRFGEETDLDKNFSDQWAITLNHSQTIDPTTSLTASLNFVSSKTYYDNSTNNYNDLLRQNALSNFTINKTWEGTPNSISLNYYRDQNLVTGEIRENLPSVNFTRSQTFPFRGKNYSALEPAWYDMISFNYNAQFLNRRTKLYIDASNSSLGYVKDSRKGLQQHVDINIPVKMSAFTITPLFNYTETWYNKSITKQIDPVTKLLVTTDISGFKAFRYFATGISANTRLVGIFNTNFLGVKGFRHTINPSISFTYHPDFSKPGWNAWGTYTDTTGREIKYSYFEREVFSGAPSGESRSLGLSLGNIFEMKTSATDTTDNKFQLLNLDAGISYNFVADSLKLSNLNLTGRTNISDFLNINASANFSFYKYIKDVGRVNTFLWKSDRKIMQLTNFGINISTSFRGGEESATKKDSTQKNTYDYTGYGDEQIDYSIPWSVSINYNYSFDRSNPFVLTKSSNINANLGFSLTKNWKFTLAAGYDIFQKQFTAPLVTIYRDLHCWEMNFSWIPTGSFRGYRFEIRVKASQLQDVKVTKQSNYRGVY